MLAQSPELPEAIRTGLNPEQYRVVHRVDVEEAEPLLRHGLTDVAIVDVEITNVQGLWVIEKLHRRMPNCPIVVFTGAKQWEWEEEAYLQGVAYVLTKPFRARLLNALLDRLWPAATRPAPRAMAPRGTEIIKAPEPASLEFQSLQVLRDFSSILTHSLCAEALLKQFLLLLRKIIGVNRAAIFLRQPFTMFEGVPAADERRNLRSACAIGLSPGLLEHFELSFEEGIGGYLFRQGRILRRDSEQARTDAEMLKEFELIGAEVAIPILDRETLVGVAVFDGRVTGEPLANNELELIFHLLEELGLAVKNIWLHDQLAANHAMMTDILRQLSSACVVVSSDLSIVHANKTARKYFTRAGRRTSELEFSDLPQILGGKVYQVLKTGTGVASFKYEPDDSPGTIHNVTIVPFQRPNSVLPKSVLMVIEDFTQTEKLQRLEIEAANLRLVKMMADRLAHEIGNALVPLSTHQQLLADKYGDPDFRNSLSTAMGDGVKRINRLAHQMLFLARDNVERAGPIQVKELIEEAFYEAQNNQCDKPARLHFENSKQPLTLLGDRAGLTHALAEVMLNALQANPPDPQVHVRLHADTDSHGERWVRIEVEDPGTGFSAETGQKALEPFFSTRNVGLGLGLTVTRKIIETHRGKVEIAPGGKSSSVRISLPAANRPAELTS